MHCLKCLCACFLRICATYKFLLKSDCGFPNISTNLPMDLCSLDQIDPFPQCLDTESCGAESTKRLILLCSDFDSSWG